MPGEFYIETKVKDGLAQIDIAATEVTIPIRIESQVTNLDVNIAAQTIGNLDINIAASDITMNVAVTGTANISINAQTIGVYLQPEWAAKEGTHKTLDGLASGISFGEEAAINYTVPAGKTLFINSFSGRSNSDVAENADANQICGGYISVAGDYFAQIGGNGGFSMLFPVPVVASSGQLVIATIYNYSNHTYEI